jgi:hydroxymethylbilane synthase
MPAGRGLMRIGTRGSPLALAQASWVAGRLGELGSSGVESVEIVEITTSGDRGERLLDKARWTSELERALLEGRIDVAVHSAKDVPGEVAPGTELAAVPAREDPVDVLCGGASLASLPRGARVGTSSLRRTAQLRALRDDLRIVDLRGNVDTRLRKLAAGEADALVLAAAGLRRLGRLSEAGRPLTELVPAPGQGALALQTRSGEGGDVRVLADPGAEACVLAERAFARGVGASCNTPVGALATLAAAGTVELRVWIGLPDGSEWISDRASGAAAEVGAIVAERTISVGARALLDRAERLAEVAR